MQRYVLWVRLNPFQTTNTYVFASNQYEAKLLGEAQYGVGNVLSYREDSAWSSKYRMRIHEIALIKPIKSLAPLKARSLAQTRLDQLKLSKERANKAYEAERDRQKLIRDQNRVFNLSRGP